MTPSDNLKSNSDERIVLANERTSLALERTKLANERTFLSWIRTSLACIGGGIAIVRFIEFRLESHQVIAQISGDILILIGIVFLILSLMNYRKIKTRFGVYKSATLTNVLTVSVIILILISTVLLIII
jgi:putative membrane protein